MMGIETGISWATSTFNSWWGCTRVSPGCGVGKSVGGCYAEALAKSWGHRVWGVDAPRRFFGDKHWNEPLLWHAKAVKLGQPWRVFCASMCDVFEDRRDLDEQRTRLWDLIERTPKLDWLLLTKRPHLMTQLAPSRWRNAWPLNVWAGTTTEDQKYYDARWQHLAKVPAATRFVSHEPAIGPLTLRCADCGDSLVEHRGSTHCPGLFPTWTITGGESGGGPRPYQIEWARDILAQCAGTNVVPFVKQMGANAITSTNSDRVMFGDTAPEKPHFRLKLADRAGSDPTEWPQDVNVQRFPPSLGH
jgi:protein gp37